MFFGFCFCEYFVGLVSVYVVKELFLKYWMSIKDIIKVIESCRF